jgi:hypothetical protein
LKAGRVSTEDLSTREPRCQPWKASHSDDRVTRAETALGTFQSATLEQAKSTGERGPVVQASEATSSRIRSGGAAEAGSLSAATTKTASTSRYCNRAPFGNSSRTFADRAHR